MRDDGSFLHCTVMYWFYSGNFVLSPFFWTRTEGPPTGSRQRQHSAAARITVIKYTTMTKLNEDCEKETQAVGQTVEQDTQQTVTKRERDTGTKATVILHTVQTKSKLPLCVSPSLLGTQKDFHVSALCVEDPSPPLTPTVDAIHRRHPSTPPFDATIRRHHRRRAQPKFRCILSLFMYDRYLSTVVAPSPYQQVLRAIHHNLFSQFSHLKAVTPAMEAIKADEDSTIDAIGAIEPSKPPPTPSKPSKPASPP